MPEGERLAVSRRRDRRTRRSVLLADRIADWTIRIGGIGVIVAVFAIIVFLAQVAAPLFGGARVEGERKFSTPAATAKTLGLWVDEYKSLALTLLESGEISLVHIASGRSLPSARFDFGGNRVTSFGRTLTDNYVAFGFADGRVRLGRLDISAQTLPGDAIPANAERLDANSFVDGQTLYARIAGNQVRKISIATRLEPAQDIVPGKAIVAIDYRHGGTAERPSEAFVTLDSAGIVRLSRTETRRNMLTGKEQKTVTSIEFPPLPAGAATRRILMNESGDEVYLGARDGTIYRYDARNVAAPVLAETQRLLTGDATLGVFGFLNGDQSLVVGGSDGSVNIYFRLRREARADAGEPTADEFALVRAHALEKQPAGLIAFAASQRTKMFATADAQGNVWVRHSTSEQTLLRLAAGAAPEAIALAPRDDGVIGRGGAGNFSAWDISAPHPETTLKTIFGKVWYEGYDAPAYTWQSSSATDTFEPKLSLTPLIFGTFKATLYSLLFAVPIAILAAIYTSEFVHHTVRAIIKPTMEVMASLPSVVLGFIAALVLAPFVETWIAPIILGFLLLPLSLLGGAMVWQTLPAPLALRFGGLPKFALMFAALGLGGIVAYALAGPFEKLFFAGDFKLWADGQIGSDRSLLALILWPLSFVAAWLGFERLGGPFGGDAWRGKLRTWPRTFAGIADGTRTVGLLIFAGLLAAAAAVGLDSLGLGPRGSLVDTYVQRNVFVVGFAMGFAVIPIIYTIAEDSLNAVPAHLRAASLACGATPWQTAIRVVLPTAISGVFAAVMIGMGRAVGETMIVVMAAGNTPILDLNVFSGLRALSANIAVELPEAVRDGTLYRMLFLAAIVLFGMTFVVNTLAELVRLRFRKRAAQL
jgi:phosphate transport system permease protein